MSGQVHEILILDGKQTSMAFCPPLPKNDSRVIELEDSEIFDCDITFSTACWRKYIGTWEIKDHKFYLSNIVGRFKLVVDAPVFADWFTGILRIPQGEILNYVHMGYSTVYEREMHIYIENGMVTKCKIIDNRNKDVNQGELDW